MGNPTDFENLREAILEGDQEAAVAIGQQLADSDESLLEPVNVASDVIREVGDKFGAGEVFLPEMVLAAEAMQGFMDVVTDDIEVLTGKPAEDFEEHLIKVYKSG